MLVTRSNFGAVIRALFSGDDPRTLACDTETSGLRPYHDDRLFAIIINNGKESFYFNWNIRDYENAFYDPEIVLDETHIRALEGGFSHPNTTWFFHNAKFDMAFLEKEGLHVAGTVYDTKQLARITYNDHFDGYSLSKCAARIGLAKDDAVEKYIKDHHVWDYIYTPVKKKNKYYDQVPLEIMLKYGEIDAEVTYKLGMHHLRRIDELAERHQQGRVHTVRDVRDMERRLLSTIYGMEKVGVRISKEYCLRAAQYETDRANEAAREFEKLTQRVFCNSGKVFAEVFASEQDKWEYTEKGNPSFKSDIIKQFDSPAAKEVIKFRDATSKKQFYESFLYHADENGDVHPTFDPAGAASGRFSSSEPNFQNLKKDEEEALEAEFCVRRALVPRPGFNFVMIDYDQMEYKMMLDYAGGLVGRKTSLISMVQDGHDVHQATADLVTGLGVELTRKKAKNGNFATLYGSGYDTLAKTIKATRQEAIQLKTSIFKVAPEMKEFTRRVSQVAKRRGFIMNWFGRISWCEDPNFSYKMPNYCIQGGCADVNKIALVEIDEYLKDKKSRLVMTIHDENVLEVHESEMGFVPQAVKEIMENVYPYRYLKLTAGAEWSDISLADKKEFDEA